MLQADVLDLDQARSPPWARSEWTAAVLDRAETERADYWFEALSHPRFGQTLALVYRGLAARLLVPHGEPMASDAVIVLRVDWDEVERRLEVFARDFGLSAAVSRVVLTLIRSGDVRQAAALTGISYETAREYLEKARNALGAENLPRLVTFVTLGASIDASAGEETDALLIEAFGLTHRQVRIAGLAANGLSRREVAQEVGVSDALAKKELAEIFAATGAGSAIELARVLVEMRLFALRLRAVSAPEGFTEHAHTDLFVSSHDGRRVAVSDYGPPDGRPVVVMHSSMTSRPVNGALVRALKARGFRPVSIDRPGFGLTWDAPVDCDSRGYLDLAARDLLAVLAFFDWSAVPIVTRGAAQALLALHHLAPEAIAAAVVMNPDPDARSSGRRDTFLAKMKRHFAARPGAVRLMAAWLARSATLERIRDHFHRATAGCDADRRAMAIEANVRDYYRGVLPFRDGRIDGFVREQVALATLGKPAVLDDTAHFLMLVGQYDTIHDPDETLRYWQSVLPRADVRKLNGAGRFMSYSHADAIARLLSDMVAAASRA